jgi:ATP-dependent Clp protease ATP-binding subunit ClpA
MAEHGYEPEFGARPMGRLVDQAIKKQLAEALLLGALKNGGTATFDVKADKSGIEPSFTAAPEVPAPPAPKPSGPRPSPSAPRA